MDTDHVHVNTAGYHATMKRKFGTLHCKIHRLCIAKIFVLFLLSSIAMASTPSF